MSLGDGLGGDLGRARRQVADRLREVAEELDAGNCAVAVLITVHQDASMGLATSGVNYMELIGLLEWIKAHQISDQDVVELDMFEVEGEIH